MIYIASFVIFILFVVGMSLGFLIKRKPLLSENEANDILDGLTCATCTSGSCGFAGSQHKRNPAKKCKADLVIAHKNV